MKNIISKILQFGILPFIFRFLGMFFAFLIMWLIPNYVGNEEVLGRYSLALTWLQIIATISAMGIPYAFVSFSGKFETESSVEYFLIKNTKLLLLLSLIPSIVFIFFGSFIALHFYNNPLAIPYFKAIGFIIPFLMFHELLGYYFVSKQKYFLHGLFVFLLPNLLLTLFLLFISVQKLETYYCFWAYGLSIFITVFVFYIHFFITKLKITNLNIHHKEILKKSTPMMIGALFLILLNWTDVVVLGFFVDDGSIGIYNTAFKVGYLTLFVVMTMSVVLMPRISKNFHDNDFTTMKKNIHSITQVTALLTFPIAFVLIVFGNYILNMFGPNFNAGYLSLVLITLGAFFSAICGNVDQILNMTNNEKLVKNTFLFGFLLNLVLNLWFIPLYGITGSAAASLITNVVVNVTLLFIVKKKLGFYTLF